jgi:hypothetical protein
VKEEDVRQEFQVHRLNEHGMAKVQKFAGMFDALMAEIEDAAGWSAVDRSPSARCVAVARTDLERACFYAKKSVALREENQEKL